MNKLLKRVTAIALSGVLVATAFAGCSAKSENDDSKDADKVYKVGVCQLMEHEALDAATEGFQQALKDKLGEDKVQIEVKNAQGDSNTCSTINNQFVSSGVDLIMANATPALQSATAITNTIPIVATSITEYGVALDIADFSGKTGMNVTGTSDLPPLDQQAAMIKEICPDTKTVGIIYCSAEANSKYQATEIAKYLANDGITAKEYPFADSNDLQSVVTKAVSENDALYVPTDNTAAENTPIIDAVARPEKCPVFAGEEGICRGCGVVTLSIKYYDIGYAAGEMAAKILTEGADPATMDIGYAPEFTKEYNKEICDELGITIPSDYVALAPAAAE